jgi:hypothetical protein
MKISGIQYLLISIGSFVLSYVALALAVSLHAPTPEPSGFSHITEVTGTYRYHQGSSRAGGNTTWLNDKPLNCMVSGLNADACLGQMKTVPQGTQITAELVYLKTISGNTALAMKISSSNRQIFNQTPSQCIKAWRNSDALGFATVALIISILTVGFTKIASDYLPMIKAGKLLDEASPRIQIK